MDQRTDQIESHIHSKQQALQSNFQELEKKIKSVTDWRHQFQNHPAAMVVTAFGAGVLLAKMLGHRKGRRVRAGSSNAPQTSANAPHSRTERRKHEVLKSWHNIESALIGVAAAKFKGMLSDIVPGFKEQLDKTEGEGRGDSINLEPPPKV